MIDANAYINLLYLYMHMYVLPLAFLIVIDLITQSMYFSNHIVVWEKLENHMTSLNGLTIRYRIE